MPLLTLAQLWPPGMSHCLFLLCASFASNPTNVPQLGVFSLVLRYLFAIPWISASVFVWVRNRITQASERTRLPSSSSMLATRAIISSLVSASSTVSEKGLPASQSCRNSGYRICSAETEAHDLIALLVSERWCTLSLVVCGDGSVLLAISTTRLKDRIRRRSLQCYLSPPSFELT